MYRIDYTITEDGKEIGFGGSPDEKTIDQALYFVQSAIANGEWETS